jgi:hypothetical protein
LWHPSPSDVLDEDLLFFGSSLAVFLLDFLEGFDSRYVVVELRANATLTKIVRRCDVVIVAD